MENSQAIIAAILDENNLEICDDEDKMGKGAFGQVFKVRHKNRKNIVYAAKVILKDVENNKERIRDFRGRNIIKINKDYEGSGNSYYMYLMEVSNFGNLGKLPTYLEKEKERKIFKEPFVERFGDNLLRFFVKQMILGLRTFYEGNFVHFDIKPENMLIFKNLEIKFIDFNFLRKLDDEGYDKSIPGGTPGYVTPDFYNGKTIGDDDFLRSQDYFAIGSTIFYLKYNKKMIRQNNIEGTGDGKAIRDIMRDNTTSLIEEAMDFIKRQKYQDKDFIDFLCNLIQFKYENRPKYEEIINNKWLNKNSEEIEKIRNLHFFDESILLLELQKSDFLIDNLGQNIKTFDEKNDLDDKVYINNKRGKFKFGKKRRK